MYYIQQPNIEFNIWLNHQIAEDVRERWETSDHPVVHKIQEYVILLLSRLVTGHRILRYMFIVLILLTYFGSLNETVFGETDSAMSFKEIRQRDPYVKSSLCKHFDIFQKVP